MAVLAEPDPAAGADEVIAWARGGAERHKRHIEWVGLMFPDAKLRAQALALLSGQRDKDIEHENQRLRRVLSI